MHRLLAAGVLLAFVTGCAGSGAGSGVPNTVQPNSTNATVRQTLAVGPNVIVNPGFETGSLSPWTSCGTVAGDAVISTAQAHSGVDSVLIGTTAKPEVNGTAAVCQTVTVPAAATLTFWVFEGTNDTIKFVDQEADILSTSGTQLAQIYSEAVSGGGWVEKTFNMSAYAGETVQLYFGVKGDGFSSDFVYEYLDDVSLTGTVATPSPTPTPVPTATPVPTPTPVPTATPSATPTPVPTTSPTATPFPCNNAQFATDQSEFVAGTITADQLVNICGTVTQVNAETDTSSGHHGDYFVQLPSGVKIEILSNLDAMAEASTDTPPATWPWVAVGDFVYVQGRYFFDSSSSQGIDWTEDDTDSNWEHVGFVAVCNSAGANCLKYW